MYQAANPSKHPHDDIKLFNANILQKVNIFGEKVDVPLISWMLLAAY